MGKRPDEPDRDGDGVADDIEARFPKPETDERLQAARVELPPVPEIQFERPKTRTANPPKPGEAGKGGLGSGGSMLGGDLRGLGQASTLGITLVVSIAVGAGFGYLADRYLIKSATPWGLIVGFLLGVASGFVNLIRVAGQLDRDAKK